ncbi:MAG: hypothetical protein OEL53_02405 [Rhodospirillales bacterium]|nr:hypothetical protein [Rhodospirillales bacterium]
MSLVMPDPSVTPARYKAIARYSILSVTGSFPQRRVLASISLSAGVVNRTRLTLPLDKITPRRIEVFGKALRNRLLDQNHGFGKAYLRLMVDEIRIEGKTARIKGSEEGLVRAALLAETGEPVPRAIPLWRPLGDDGGNFEIIVSL